MERWKLSHVTFRRRKENEVSVQLPAVQWPITEHPIITDKYLTIPQRTNRMGSNLKQCETSRK